MYVQKLWCVLCKCTLLVCSISTCTRSVTSNTKFEQKIQGIPPKLYLHMYNVHVLYTSFTLWWYIGHQGGYDLVQVHRVPQAQFDQLVSEPTADE